jgi:uncharacterized cysteine cluster protein YcgN (CxxCxxCC family)
MKKNSPRNVDQSNSFWKSKSFSEMTSTEWESLCDGCAKCCLVKLQDEETDEVAYTNVACRFLNTKTCQCKEYEKRIELVPLCTKLTPERVDEFFWLPETCAYRLVAEGKDLPKWHHLISGSKSTIHAQGVSMKNKTFSEANVHEDHLEEYIIHWVN